MCGDPGASGGITRHRGRPGGLIAPDAPTSDARCPRPYAHRLLPAAYARFPRDRHRTGGLSAPRYAESVADAAIEAAHAERAVVTRGDLLDVDHGGVGE